MTNVQPKVIGGSRVYVGVLLVGLLSAGCSSSDLVLPRAESEIRLSLVSGNQQTGTVGEQLPKPLVMEVRDQDGRVVTGRKIAFVPIDGPSAARFTPDTAITDGDGQAVGQWRLGTSPGVYGAEARLIMLEGEPQEGGRSIVGVTAAAKVGGPDTLAAVSETSQTGSAGAVAGRSPTVRVVDRFGNPVSGAVVRWKATGGGGSVSATTTLTDADGRATVTWTFGRNLSQRVEASIEGSVIEPVEFFAIVI